MSSGEIRPIIIKRKKVIAGGGHHGGAWKVAYADFVTAMMAFFMLMWLLNATTETQRKGLADYFSPTIAVARVSGGGDSAFGGDSLMSENALSKNGSGGFVDLELNVQAGTTSQSDNGNEAPSDEEILEAIQAGLAGKGGESLVAEMALKHIITRVTDEGIVIEIFDIETYPLFVPETDRPTDILREITQILSDTIMIVKNRVSIAAHSRAYSQVLIDNPAWRLTAARADIMRRLLEDEFLPAERVERVIGYGQQKPLLENTMAYRNNRLEVVLLREQPRAN